MAILAFAGTAALLGRLCLGRARRLPAGARDRGITLGAPPPPRQRRVVPFGMGIRIHPRPLRAVVQSTGAVFGAGYTAVHVTSWALWAAALLTVAFVALAYAVVATGQARRLAVLAGGFVAAVFLILVVLPISVQRFVVLPNELALEEPYLRRDIAFTGRPSAWLRSRCALTSPVPPSTWPRSRRTGTRSTTSVSGIGSRSSRPSGSCSRSAATIHSRTSTSTGTGWAIATTSAALGPRAVARSARQGHHLGQP